MLESRHLRQLLAGPDGSERWEAYLWEAQPDVQEVRTGDEEAEGEGVTRP